MVLVADVSRRTRRRRLCTAAGGVAALGIVAFVSGDDSIIAQLTATLRPGRAANIRDLGSLAISSPNYGKPSSVHRGHYPFGNATIVEPYKRSNLIVGGRVGASATLAWTVSTDAGTTVDAWSATGPSTTFAFTEAGRAYVVAALDDQGNAATPERVLCKYVRREVRQLSDADRRAFFAAVAEVYTVSTVEGQRKYGGDFRSGASWFARWHLGSASAMSPWHGGPSFFPSHAILTSYFERALQAVDPSVAAHYWDFTIDAAAAGDWTASEVWSADYFGPVGDAKSPRARGRWENVTAPVGLAGAVTNSFGILNEPYNNNPEAGLTRAFSLCGLPTKAFALPGCAQLEVAAANKNMDRGDRPFETAIQIDLHFELHPLLGGAWDCAVNAGDFIATNASAPYVDAVSAAVRDVASFALMNFYTGKLSCPESCGAGEACACSCVGANLDADNDDAMWYSLFTKHVADVMYDIPQPQIVMPFTYERLETNAAGRYVFKNLTAPENADLYAFFVKEVCAPPSFSPFASALASAGDPIFFPVHANYERVWTHLRLDRGFDSAWNVSGMDANDDMIVTGYRYDDPVEPFSEAYGARREPPGSYYTNREIVALFDPALSTLPFIFEDLDWDHCAAS